MSEADYVQAWLIRAAGVATANADAQQQKGGVAAVSPDTPTKQRIPERAYRRLFQVNFYHQFDKTHPIWDSVDAGDWGAVEAMVVSDPSLINITGEDVTGTIGVPLLHFAAAGGNVGIVEFLIEKGVGVDWFDGDDRTALHYAAMFTQNVEILKLLISAGADIDAQDMYGRTALYFAAFDNPNVEILRFLVDAGADPSIRTAYLSEHRADEFPIQVAETEVKRQILREAMLKALIRALDVRIFSTAGGTDLYFPLFPLLEFLGIEEPEHELGGSTDFIDTLLGFFAKYGIEHVVHVDTCFVPAKTVPGFIRAAKYPFEYPFEESLFAWLETFVAESEAKIRTVTKVRLQRDKVFVKE
jgi:hypothetical protein